LTPSNVTFKVAGAKDATSNAIAGDIEGKYVDFKHGLIFTQVCCFLSFAVACIRWTGGMGI
jgi:hypothetical protein